MYIRVFPKWPFAESRQNPKVVRLPAIPQQILSRCSGKKKFPLLHPDNHSAIDDYSDGVMEM